MLVIWSTKDLLEWKSFSSLVISGKSSRLEIVSSGMFIFPGLCSAVKVKSARSWKYLGIGALSSLSVDRYRTDIESDLILKGARSRR